MMGDRPGSTQPRWAAAPHWAALHGIVPDAQPPRGWVAGGSIEVGPVQVVAVARNDGPQDQSAEAVRAVETAFATALSILPSARHDLESSRGALTRGIVRRWEVGERRVDPGSPLQVTHLVVGLAGRHGVVLIGFGEGTGLIVLDDDVISLEQANARPHAGSLPLGSGPDTAARARTTRVSGQQQPRLLWVSTQPLDPAHDPRIETLEATVADLAERMHDIAETRPDHDPERSSGDDVVDPESGQADVQAQHVVGPGLPAWLRSALTCPVGQVAFAWPATPAALAAVRAGAQPAPSTVADTRSVLSPVAAVAASPGVVAGGDLPSVIEAPAAIDETTIPLVEATDHVDGAPVVVDAVPESEAWPDDAPMAPDDAPMAPNDAPMAPDDAPVAPNDAPMVPDDAPTASPAPWAWAEETSVLPAPVAFPAAAAEPVEATHPADDAASSLDVNQNHAAWRVTDEGRDEHAPEAWYSGHGYDDLGYDDDHENARRWKWPLAAVFTAALIASTSWWLLTGKTEDPSKPAPSPTASRMSASQTPSPTRSSSSPSATETSESPSPSSTPTPTPTPTRVPTRAPVRRPTVPVVVPTSALPTPEPTTPTNPPNTTPPPTTSTPTPTPTQTPTETSEPTPTNPETTAPAPSN